MRRLVGGTRFVREPLAVAVVALIVLAGCGSSKADDAGDPQATDDAAADASTTSTTKAAAKAGSSKSKAQASATSTTTSTTVTPKAGTAATGGQPVEKLDDEGLTLPISAELKESCVRPGGSQTITIRARTASGVGYDSVYSDGKSGAMEGHYGGNAGGYTDDKNTFTSTWVISAAAPAGPVLVRVLGTHEEDGLGQTEAHFSVADALGKCS